MILALAIVMRSRGAALLREDGALGKVRVELEGVPQDSPGARQ